jgi:hypothetical protein
MKKITILKSCFAVASFITLFSLSGCEKSSTLGSNVKPDKEKLLTIHCSPYRSLVGYSAVCTELNSVSNCLIQECTGNSTIITLTNYVLVNPATSSYFIFASNQTITASEQNDVMLAAKAWATANLPSGYFVRYISYTPDIIVSSGTPTYAGIDITVTYKKCTGGGIPID